MHTSPCLTYIASEVEVLRMSVLRHVAGRVRLYSNASILTHGRVANRRKKVIMMPHFYVSDAATCLAYPLWWMLC